MGEKYLIDTNVLIDAQMHHLPNIGLDFLTTVINENFIISFITLIEYLGYKSFNKSSEEFISLADVIYVDKQIIQSCIDIRKNYNIKLPDAIIASTALVHGLILVTNNEKDFLPIHNLIVLNPYSLSQKR